MLKGKTAVITGASRGIGAAIAEKFAAQGADVALICAAHIEAAQAICARLRADCGVRAEAFGCDVADFAAVKVCVAAIRERFGDIHILVNNAGIKRDGLIATMKERDFDDVLNVNLKGAFNLIRHVSPIFIRNRGGKIINISSVAGLSGNAGQANYAASKAGVIGLTKSVARELASRGVSCNAIAPGFIQTDMTQAIEADHPMLAGVPLGRMGSCADVAALAAFLAGEDAGYITGEVFRVDGGLSM